MKLWNFLFYGRRTPLKCTSRKIRNILQIEQDGVKAIKYKTALIPILRYILAAIVTCDQAIFFFLARGNFPPPKNKKKKKSPDRRLLPSLPWIGCLLSFLLLTAVLTYTVIGRIARG